MILCKNCKYFIKSPLYSDFDRCSKFDTFTFISRNENGPCSPNATFFEANTSRQIHYGMITPQLLYVMILSFLKKRFVSNQFLCNHTNRTKHG